jgi:hypothetical protein
MSRRPLVLPSLLLAACALLVAGCGGAGSPDVAGVASSTGATQGSGQGGALAFAQCLRAHGIPNWPDPTAGGVFDKSKLRQLGVSPARVRAVEEGPCHRLVPLVSGHGSQPTAQQQRTRLADGLSFARCMRHRGVARFPDPTAQGVLSVEMVQAQGIDVHSSAVLRVVQKCLPASHGGLTAAKVREALEHAGG